MMTYMDFMDKCAAVFGRGLCQITPEGEMPAPFPGMDLGIRDTHFFYLGHDSDIQSAIESVEHDLNAEILSASPSILQPFKDTTYVSVLENAMLADRVIELPDNYMIGYKAFLIANKKIRPGDYAGVSEEDIIAAKGYIVWRVSERVVMGVSAMAWIDIEIKTFINSNGVMTRARVCYPSLRPSAKTKQESLNIFLRHITEECDPIIRQSYLVSHPSNYIIKTCPVLTIKEQHRIERGNPVPIRKLPHFIVVDHQVLVRMRRGSTSDPEDDRVSPCPHHRRGHWARLAERCRHARLLGKDKIWRRPTFVGDVKWADTKNHYEVLLDFGKKNEGVLSESR